MTDADLNRIAQDMLTTEFVDRLRIANRNIAAALKSKTDYGDDDLARDLDLPLPVARILMSYTGASAAERETRRIIDQCVATFTEARH